MMSSIPLHSGKVAIVTASTEGIGYAIAKHLANNGAKIVVSSRKQANVDMAVKEMKKENLIVHGLVCNVGKKEDRTRLIEETLKMFGGIDILILNAGINLGLNLSAFEITEKQWDKMFDINLKSAFFLCKEAIPYFSKNKGCNIILISSISAYTYIEDTSIYGITKLGLLAACKVLAQQCASMNIRVNGIVPGPIRTKMGDQYSNSPKGIAVESQKLAIKRRGEPEECAALVSFLVSADASYITGENICIDGGFTSRL